MKVIFLDIDGVLNSREYDARCALTGSDLMRPDPKLVVRLLAAIQPFDAKIVLTSSWRLDKTIQWPFPVYDVTPRVDGTRAEEIKAWLKGTGECAEMVSCVDPKCVNVDAFVILDDEPDAGIGFGDRFIQTDPRTGLTAEDADRIVGLFT